MKVAELFVLMLVIVALQAWCAGWAYAFLLVAQTLPLDDEWERLVAIVAACGGVAFGIWTAYLLWRRRPR